MDLTSLELNEISNLIDLNVVRRLGLHLGFEHAEIQRFEKANDQNPSHSPGTEDMLFAWQRRGGTRPLLCSALREVEQTRLAIRIEEGEFRMQPVGVPSTVASASFTTPPSRLPNTTPARVPPTHTSTTPSHVPEPEAAVYNVQAHHTTDQTRSGGRVKESVNLDVILYQLAEDIDDHLVGRLGQALNFRPAQVNRYESTNHAGGRMSTRGTVGMLNDWKMRTPVAKQKEDLRQALIVAKMLSLAEQYLPLE